MGGSHRTEETPGDWPECDSGRIRVMLLGTYHMDDPGLDEVNVDADDVLAPERQAELAELTGRLAEWNPDRIAVERPYDRADAVNALYEEYRSGEREYDREEEFEPPHDRREESDTECRSEVVQVGFRLADELDHERVYPVDDPMDISNDDYEALAERGFEPETKAGRSPPDLDDHKNEADERLANSTVTEYLEWVNREEQLRLNHDWMFGRYLPRGEGDNFGGPRVLSAWYDRNLRTAHNLWRATERGDDRILLVVGAGHVRVLRHLLGEAPMFRPVSPRPLLR